MSNGKPNSRFTFLLHILRWINFAIYCRNYNKEGVAVSGHKETLSLVLAWLERWQKGETYKVKISQAGNMLQAHTSSPQFLSQLLGPACIVGKQQQLRGPFCYYSCFFCCMLHSAYRLCCFTVTIKRTKNRCTLHLGIGSWVQYKVQLGPGPNAYVTRS